MKTRLAKKICYLNECRCTLAKLQEAVKFLNKKAYHQIKHKLVPGVMIRSKRSFTKDAVPFVKVSRNRTGSPLGVETTMPNGAMYTFPIFDVIFV